MMTGPDLFTFHLSFPADRLYEHGDSIPPGGNRTGYPVPQRMTPMHVLGRRNKPYLFFTRVPAANAGECARRRIHGNGTTVRHLHGREPPSRRSARRWSACWSASASDAGSPRTRPAADSPFSTAASRPKAARWPEDGCGHSPIPRDPSWLPRAPVSSSSNTGTRRCFPRDRRNGRWQSGRLHASGRSASFSSMT